MLKDTYPESNMSNYTQHTRKKSIWYKLVESMGLPSIYYRYAPPFNHPQRARNRQPNLFSQCVFHCYLGYESP